MRAVLCQNLGAPEDLVIADLPTPEPGPGEVLIEVAAAGLNFADSLIIKGKYQEKPEPPFVPGFEAVGRVLALGPGVEGFQVGERVMALPDYGAFAEQLAVRHEHVFKLPDGMTDEVAAGFPINYGTAHGALAWHGRLQLGEILLVHGAAGGTGLAAVEIGKAMGATVIATAGGSEKLALAQAHGADHLIDYRQEDIRERVKDITEGRGADVVFDPIGGDVFEASLRSIAWEGRLLVVGFAGGRVQQIPANHLLVKNVAALGIYWGSYRKKAPHRLKSEFDDLFDWFQAGELKPFVSHSHSIEQAGEAIRFLLDRKSKGKMVLTMGAAASAQQ
ncbi:MAG: NADPH:quinone oxidoreductase family protein [Pseudomonadota bacterium]